MLVSIPACASEMFLHGVNSDEQKLTVANQARGAIAYLFAIARTCRQVRNKNTHYINRLYKKGRLDVRKQSVVHIVHKVSLAL